jgi:small-conductance mechanosensitive channel
VRREYLRRIKATFDDRDIEIPFPHLTLYAGAGKDGDAPALPLRVDSLRREAVNAPRHDEWEASRPS